jgi:eukaryotic-like serine/threonine-protein kinase
MPASFADDNNPEPQGPSAEAPLIIGRYAIFDAIASGGMATVHLGRLIGPEGFSRTVAIKRLHPHFANDPDFTAMFLDEARMAARVQHPNVIPTIDVLRSAKELLLVMEYVRGDSLGRLIRSAASIDERIPPRIVVAIMSGALQGLHAAHEATSERGTPLGLVHRDMSPQNILIGVDGSARVLDFGVAKAEGRMQNTQEGQIKGKLMYMPPEQLAGVNVTRTADIYSMGVVLFEVLTGERMFAGENEGAALGRILNNQMRMPSEVHPDLARFDAVVNKAVAGNPLARYETARDMAHDLETCVLAASPSEVGAWVEHLARTALATRARRVSEIESSSSTSYLKVSSAPPPATIPMPPLNDDASSIVMASSTFGSGANNQKRTSQKLVVGLAALLLVATVAILYLMSSKFLRYDRDFAANAATVASATVPTSIPPISRSIPDPNQVPPIATEAPAPTNSATPPKPSADIVRSSGVAPVAATAKPVSNQNQGTIKPAIRNCNPPFSIDSNGHRHYFPECPL